MKKVFYLLTLAFVSFLLSCEQNNETQATPEATGELSIVLPSLNKQVTYSSISTEAENGSENDIVRIYLFKNDETFVRSVDAFRSEPTIPISLSGIANQGKLVVLTGPANGSLPIIEQGQTLSDLTSSTFVENNLLSPSFYTANSAVEGNAYVTVTPTESQKQIDLVRRAVRLDFGTAGDYDKYPFTIKTIIVQNATNAAKYVDLPTEYVEAATTNFEAEYETLAENNDFRSAYILPTTLGPRKTRIEIVTEDKITGVENTWEYTTEVELKSNHRYTFTLDYDGFGLKFNFTIADWTMWYIPATPYEPA